MAKRPPVTSQYTYPLCDAPMVERSGRFGEFIGCTRYPECKGGRNMDGKISAMCEAMIREQKQRKARRKRQPDLTPGQMGRLATIGRLRRRGVLAVSVAFTFRSTKR